MPTYVVEIAFEHAIPPEVLLEHIAYSLEVFDFSKPVKIRLISLEEK